MDIFNSPWLINMLAKSSKTPQGRLLSLFDILDDWLKAPHIEKVSTLNAKENSLLIAFCTEQAKLLGAENPDILAEHIVLVAHSAAQQLIEQPGSSSLMHAKKVANALILAQTQKNGFISNLTESKPAIYSIAASLLLLVGTASLWLPSFMYSQTAHARMAQQHDPVETTIVATAYGQDKALTAIDASRMYAKYEQMRQGTCHFPEVLQIPDKHKSIYLENVVGGKLPANSADLAIANFYLEKVHCNFTPMLMTASK
ncbi:MAG: hypothetical protein WA123_00440 [Methylotenera sp.]